MKRIALLLAVISLFAGCRKEVLPEAVALNRHALSLEVGETYVLEATVTPANVTNPTLNWSSTQPSVATVDPDGTVKALSEGQAIITATTLSGGKTDACSVTVTKKAAPDPGHNDSVQDVTVSPATLELTEGQTAQLSATVSPADASQEVEWASQNKGVAIVDNGGLVTAVAKGTTRIYARSKSNTDKHGWCEITVNEDPSLKGISLSSDVMTINVGESRTLTVTFIPDYAANKNVSWASDNPGIAGVSQEGLVTAVAVGQATITATSEDGGHKASCTVTVTDGNIALVYYLDNDGKFYVNGVEDPRNSVRNYGEWKYRLSDVGATACLGKSLYTLEKFQKKNVYYVCLCKDRVPMFEIPIEYAVFSTYLKVLSLQKDYFAILYLDHNRYKFSVFKGDYNGNVTEIPIEGSYQLSSLGTLSPRMATLPDGRIVVITCVRDSFDVWHLASYTISQDNTVSERFLTNNNADYPGVAASEEGDVYVIASERLNGDGDKHSASIFKNGEKYCVWDQGNKIFISAIACQGGHVYTAVEEQEVRDRVIIRKDGEILYSFDPQNESMLCRRPLIVTPSGDVYLTVRTNKHSTLYKNGERLYTSDWENTFDSYCVIE
ncbi:MAG: Ig-like domain-containing protein [Bacteroidales bacterium]|nr:Ig-like domain-containing protein [Bacteroidales bacterium]